MKTLQELRNKYRFAYIQFFGIQTPVLRGFCSQLPPLEVVAAASDRRDQQWVVLSPCLQGSHFKDPFWNDGPIPTGVFVGVPDACCDYMGVAHAQGCEGACWPVLHNNPADSKAVKTKVFSLKFRIPAEIDVTPQMQAEMKDLLYISLKAHVFDSGTYFSKREVLLADFLLATLETEARKNNPSNAQAGKTKVLAIGFRVPAELDTSTETVEGIRDLLLNSLWRRVSEGEHEIPNRDERRLAEMLLACE